MTSGRKVGFLNALKKVTEIAQDFFIIKTLKLLIIKTLSLSIIAAVEANFTHRWLDS